MLRFKYALILGLLSGLGFGIYAYTIGNLSVGLVVGCFTAICMTIGGYVKIFAQMDGRKFNYSSSQLSSAVYSGLANHKLDITVGGHLYLLKNTLVFQTNTINVARRHEFVIALRDITSIEITESGLVSTEIRVSTRDNDEYFLVNKAQVWKEHIDRLITARK